jgi:glyoxylase-like metal-dependent hydrolase (beta-lactamase superfamily II)
MKLHTINTGFFKLDGGAMFGVVPKVIWNKLNAADENNLCNWAMRCLLLETEERRILIDCGIGDKQSEKFFGYYYLNGEQSLEFSLKQAGFETGDITDVVLTHLHFDHCGGAVRRNSDGNLIPNFSNARYYVSEQHWQHANHPNLRERASFLPENFVPLQENGVLHFVKNDEELIPGLRMRVVNGHTMGMIIPQIKMGEKELVYCADLIPSHQHIPVHYTMGYDIEPLVVMKEKEMLYAEEMNRNRIYYFEHDPEVECATIELAENNGKPFYRLKQKGRLIDFID